MPTQLSASEMRVFAVGESPSSDGWLTALWLPFPWPETVLTERDEPHDDVASPARTDMSMTNIDKRCDITDAKLLRILQTAS